MPKFVKSFFRGDTDTPADRDQEDQEGDSEDTAIEPQIQNGTPQFDTSGDLAEQIGDDFSRDDLFGTFSLSQGPFDGASTFEQLLFLAGGFNE
jgi:hypothetical protein